MPVLGKLLVEEKGNYVVGNTCLVDVLRFRGFRE